MSSFRLAQPHPIIIRFHNNHVFIQYYLNSYAQEVHQSKRLLSYAKYRNKTQIIQLMVIPFYHPYYLFSCLYLYIMTKLGVIKGTPQVTKPEQINRRNLKLLWNKKKYIWKEQISIFWMDVFVVFFSNRHKHSNFRQT